MRQTRISKILFASVLIVLALAPVSLSFVSIASAQELPACLKDRSDLTKTANKDQYIVTSDLVPGKVTIWLSNHRFMVQDTQQMGNWSCTASNKLYFDSPIVKLKDWNGLPSCLQQEHTIAATTSTDAYTFMSSAFGKVFLWISNSAYKIDSSGQTGTWGCTGSNAIELKGATVALPSCVQKLTSLTKTEDPNNYTYRDGVYGIVSLYISNKRYVLTDGSKGSWQCDPAKDQLYLVGATVPKNQSTTGTPAATSPLENKGTCSDGIDNDNDGRMDWNGGTDAKGNLLPPDPICTNASSNEVADQTTGSKIPLIPCVNKCDLGDVMQLLNNLITFLIKFLFFPVAVFMFIYAGYKYITAQGNPSKKADIKKMIGHLIVGMLLVLCAWLIVKTLLVTIGYTDNTYFFN